MQSSPCARSVAGGAFHDGEIAGEVWWGEALHQVQRVGQRLDRPGEIAATLPGEAEGLKHTPAVVDLRHPQRERVGIEGRFLGASGITGGEASVRQGSATEDARERVVHGCLGDEALCGVDARRDIAGRDQGVDEDARSPWRP